MKSKLWLGLAAASVLLLSLCAPQLPQIRADVPTLQASSNLQAQGTSTSCVVASGSTGSCVVVHCPQGQSGAVLYVPSGLTGTVTAYTAPDVNGAPGVYGTPAWSYLPGGTTATQSLTSFPGKLYITLGSEQWVEAVFTTASSGNATATLTCSAAVAVNHGGGGGSPGPPGPNTVVTTSPGLTAVETTSSPATYQVAFNGFGNCLGLVTAQISYTCASPTAAPAQATPAAGTCIGISTPPAAGTISYTCASPTTAPITGITGSGNIQVSVSVTPNVTTTNAPTFTGALVAGSLTASGLSASSGNCVQLGTAGILTAAAGACSAGATVLVTPAASSPVTVATPATGTFVLDCPTCAVQETASPLPALQCISSNSSGKIKGAGAPCMLNYATPNATSSPNVVQNYGSMRGLFLDCGGPVPPSPAPTDCYKMIVYQASTEGCEFQYYNDLGTSVAKVEGVNGNQLAIGCDNEPDTPWITLGLDQNTRADVRNYSEGLTGDLQLGGSVYFQDQRGIEWNDASSAISPCRLAPSTATAAGVTFIHATTGTCSWKWADITPSSALCTDSTSYMNPCSGLTTNVGEVSCTISGTTCSQTATVRSGARCQATIEASDTTTLLPGLTVAVHTSGTTMTAVFSAVTSLSGTVAANYWCP